MEKEACEVTIASLSNRTNLSESDINELVTGKLSPADITEVLKRGVQNAKWDGLGVGKGLVAKLPDLNKWKEAIDGLDEEDNDNNNNSNSFNIGSSDGLAVLLRILLAGDPNGSLVAYFYQRRRWQRLALQVQLMNATAGISRERHQLDLAGCGLTKIISSSVIPPAMAAADSPMKPIVVALEASPLNLVDLVRLTFDAIERETVAESAAKDFLDKHAKVTPELFFLGSLKTPKPWSPLLERVIKNFFDLFFSGHNSSILVFSILGQQDEAFLASMVVEYYRVSALNVGKILDICHAANILPHVLQLRYFAFTMDLAVLASQRQLYPLKQFMDDTYKAVGADFVRGVLDFLEMKISVELSSQAGVGVPPPPPPQNPLTLSSVATILQFVSSGSDMPADRLEQFKMLQTQTFQVYPRLINFGQGHDQAILAHGDGSNAFPPHIEREMKLCYQRMYEEQIQIRDIITMLQRLKQSDDPQDQDVFACMVHSLFDEYRFFPEYPRNALAATAVLFGGLIYFRLIQDIPLSIALRYVLDSLKQPADSNMFKFGLQALYEFRERLNEFPTYCSILAEIPGLQSHQEIYSYVKQLAGGPGGGPGGPDVGGPPPGVPGGPDNSLAPETLIFSSIRVDSNLPEDAAQVEPPEELSDKVLFMVNNLAQSNVVARSREMAQVLEERYFRWFATYIVRHRAKQEPNYHSLYISMLKNMSNKLLESFFLRVTYLQIVKLLNSPETVSSSTDRNQLRNLGQWLGALTLGRNLPIKHRNISFKALLAEGYKHQKLVLVIPFVAKVLERAAKSKVFAPPNPWTLGIMHVLAELYHHAELKLNLKFEIEVLCNQLKLNVEELEQSHIIRGGSSAVDEVVDGVSKLNVDAANAGMVPPGAMGMHAGMPPPRGMHMPGGMGGPGGMMGPGGPGGMGPLGMGPGMPPIHGPPGVNQQQQQQQAQQQQAQQQAQAQAQVQQQGGAPGVGMRAAGAAVASAAFYDAYQNIIMSMELQGDSPFVSHPTLKQLFMLSVDKAVREVLQPVVERSVSIATIATRELVTKDFAFEVDCDKLRRAAHNVVRMLSGSLSLVTSKEPLKDSLLNNLKTLLLGQGYGEETLPLDQMAAAVAANADAICCVVEKAAIDKSLLDIEEALAASYALRQAHQGDAASFVDPQVTRFNLPLPDPLRIQPGGVTPQQMALYDSFSEGGAGLPSVPAAMAAVAGPGGQGAAAGVPAPSTPETPQAVLSQILLTVQARIDALLRSISAVTDGSAGPVPTSLVELPADHEIRVRLLQLLSLVSKSPYQNEVVLRTSQLVVNALFTQSDSQLSHESFALLLGKLCELSAETCKEVLLWLIHSSDKRKFNVPVVATLLRTRFITVTELDQSLAKQMLESRDVAAVEFTHKLIADVVLGADPCALRTDFSCCLIVLEALIKENKEGKDESKEEAKTKEEGKEVEPELSEEEKKAKEAKEAENKEKLAAAATEAAKCITTLNDTNVVIPTITELSESTRASRTDASQVSLKEQCAYIFAEWLRLVGHPGACNNLRMRYMFVLQLSEIGMLSNPDHLCVLVRTATEISVKSYCFEMVDKPAAPVGDVAVAVDGLAKLLVTIISAHEATNAKRISAFVRQLLAVVVLVFAGDHEAKSGGESPVGFNEKPYFRLFSSILCELSEAELSAESRDAIYLCLAETFKLIQPMAFPGFAFAWMTLISHRMFLPKMMDVVRNRRGWGPYLSLLEALLKFQDHFTTDKEFNEHVAVMYKGTLRIMLVILHDYPQFLIENHYPLCNVISPSFIQLRNLVLSAFPADLELPDPLTVGLKVESLAEIKAAPPLAIDPGHEAQKHGIRKLTDMYLRNPSPAIIKNLLKAFYLPSAKPCLGLGFNEISVDSTALNALVLYIASLISTATFDTSSPHLSLLTSVAVALDAEGRYFLFEAIANQLRYPNRHTYWYSCVILSLFGAHGEASLGSGKVDIQHIITRVLLERIICNRPHPWGLMITFAELLKNPSYRFWDLEFTKGSQEIEKMFASLNSHIMPTEGTE
ncbi:CCR4-Not complex component, Not1-domain-containing protein [Yarrowia lipolytica]|nr:CCR4-Not complex component, Not1-domain-containing protein [Yarrowia lipolytica]